MKQIILNTQHHNKSYRKQSALVDDEDFDFLSQWNWRHLFGRYAIRSEGTKHFLMHREIMKTPKGFDTDHINGNGLDNRRCNLRILTHAQNTMNRAKQSNSKNLFKGITKRRDLKDVDGWYVRINKDKKNYYIGDFRSQIHAAMAYDIAAKDLYGDIAFLNFPNGIHG